MYTEAGNVQYRLATRITYQLIWLQTVILFAGAMLLRLSGHSQSTRYPIAARYTALGAYSKNFADPLSIAANQAALANLKSLGIGIYGERRFLLQELSFYQVATCIPRSHGAFGITASYFGQKDYNETQLGVGYGKALGKIDLGIQFNYHSLQIAGYGKDALFNFEIGAILHISEQVYAGLHIFNPTGSKFGQDNPEKLSAAFSAGLGYEASEKVLISAEIIKEENKPVSINTGFQYVFADAIFARVGIYTESTHLYFGVGSRWRSIRADITASYHPQLGFTPGLVLIFQSTEKKE